MRKIIYLFFSMALWFAVASLDIVAFTHNNDEKGSVREEIQKKRDALKQEVEKKRDALNQRFQENRQTSKNINPHKGEPVRNKVIEEQNKFEKEIAEKRTQFMQGAADRREALKKKFGDKRGERIEILFGRMAEKFRAAIARLKQQSDKIETHLNKAAENGKEVTSLREKLSATRKKLVDVEKTLEEIKAKFTTATRESDFNASFRKIEGFFRATKEEIKNAHAALTDIVSAIKGLGGGGVATSTPNQGE